jgi:hypothetical protein
MDTEYGYREFKVIAESTRAGLSEHAAQSTPWPTRPAHEAINTSGTSPRVLFGRRTPWELASEPERSLGASSFDNVLLHRASSTFLNASHAARCVARHAVSSRSLSNVPSPSCRMSPAGRARACSPRSRKAGSSSIRRQRSARVAAASSPLASAREECSARPRCRIARPSSARCADHPCRGTAETRIR